MTPFGSRRGHKRAGTELHAVAEGGVGARGDEPVSGENPPFSSGLRSQSLAAREVLRRPVPRRGGDLRRRARVAQDDEALRTRHGGHGNGSERS